MPVDTRTPEQKKALASLGFLTLYLRREPSGDANAPRYRGRRAFDVVAYASEAAADAKQERARWQWHASGKPRPACKLVTLNCWRWRAVWLPDVVEG